MRRHTTTLAVCLCGLLAGSSVRATPSEGFGGDLLIDCIELRIRDFVEEARRREASLRVEVEILDDDCGQTVELILWQGPNSDVGASGLLVDHETLLREVSEIRRKHPGWSEHAACEAIPLTHVEAEPDTVPKVRELAADLQALTVHPILEPLLIIHGLQYELRIESGISEARFFFHAPGYPRPTAEELHPLDDWSQRLHDLLGLACDLGDEQEVADNLAGT